MIVLSKLKEERLNRKLSTTEMAKLIGVSQTMYSAIERGARTLSYKRAVKIAKLFDMTPDELFLENFKEKVN